MDAGRAIADHHPSGVGPPLAGGAFYRRRRTSPPPGDCAASASNMTLISTLKGISSGLEGRRGVKSLERVVFARLQYGAYRDEARFADGKELSPQILGPGVGVTLAPADSFASPVELTLTLSSWSRPNKIRMMTPSAHLWRSRSGSGSGALAIKRDAAVRTDDSHCNGQNGRGGAGASLSPPSGSAF